MKRWVLSAWLVAMLAASGVTKVGVIGDSISTGAAAENPKMNGYPARLADLLGQGYDVRAFARGGHTLLAKGDQPLTKRPVYQEALAFAPDVAVVMLGTNDTCGGRRGNWDHHADLAADLRAMIADLRRADPAVVVHVAGPLPMFPDRPGLEPARVADLTERAARLPEVWKTYREVAAGEPGVLWHDLSRVLDAADTADGVHPTTAGHDKLARHLAEVLTIGFEESFSVVETLTKSGIPTKAGDFHGFARFDFSPPELGRPAIVVAPRQAAKGRPWIWRARFFGHEPGLELQLLDRGWHVAYADVANLYGGPEAMAVWDRFHAFATADLGLAPKPVLEGMSRGGLPIFHWAIRHPDKVAAVYGDNPVCDFRTWPGGLDGSRGSKGDWQRLLAAWGIDAGQAKTHPQVADLLEPLARAKVPVALVIGTADDVVPPESNGERVAKRYAELDGPVKVWRKPGQGHHPHGLHPPDELRDYLMRAAGNR